MTGGRGGERGERGKGRGGGGGDAGRNVDSYCISLITHHVIMIR